jgi:hypothetical protein
LAESEVGAMSEIQQKLEAINATREHAKANGLGRGHRGTGKLSCPICKEGTIKYSVDRIRGARAMSETAKQAEELAREWESQWRAGDVILRVLLTEKLTAFLDQLQGEQAAPVCSFCGEAADGFTCHKCRVGIEKLTAFLAYRPLAET